MKLGIISPYPPLKGGIAKETEIIYHILKDTYDIQIFSFKKLYPGFLYPDKSQYDSSYEVKNSKIFYCLDSYNFFKWKKNISKIINSNCSHLIFRYWNPFFLPLYLYIIKQILRNNKTIKLYCLCDNVLSHERIIFDSYFMKFFYKKFNGYIVMSDNSRKLLLKMGFDDNKIVKSFLPIKKTFNNNLSQNQALKILNISRPKLLLLFFGLIRDYKGLDILINSMDKLKDYDVKLLIAGKCYKNKNYYKSLIKNKKLYDKIVWYDKYIPESEIHLYFSATDAIVLPYTKISQSGIVPLAYEFNKLIIASDLDSFQENILNNKTGYLFKNNNVDSLTKIIINIYNHHNFNSSKQHIKSFKSKYSKQNIINDFSLLFKL